MATMKEIAEAIESIEAKKRALKEAFEDLQKHSHSLSSFSLSWPEIDTHLTQVHSSLQSRFSLLQQNEQSLPQIKQNPENPVHQNPEIMAMCEKMEAVKLMGWVWENFKLNEGNLSELGHALKSAPDPFKLVLDATEGFHPKGKSCVVLLEALMMIEDVSFSGELRERAKNVALDWKGKLNVKGKFLLEIMGFLNLVGCFKLVDDFDKEEIFRFVYLVAKNPKAAKLCRILGLEEKVPDLVQKLVTDGKQPLAIKFVYEFKMVDKFPPVELLKTYLKDAKKLAQQLRKKGNNSLKSLGQADDKELDALRTVLKHIGEYNLGSEYPPETIEKRIKRLEELKANRKATQPLKLHQQKLPKQQLQTRSKQPVTPASSVSAGMLGIPKGVGVNTLPSSQQPYFQPPLPGLGSSVGSYAFSGSVPNVPYGLASSLLSHASNPSSAGSHLHALGSQLPSSSYQGPNPVQSYGFPPGPPQHYPSYHPQ